MSILRELWTSKESGVEAKTTYQYIIDLRQQTEEKCKLAREELSNVQSKNVNYRNKNVN